MESLHIDQYAVLQRLPLSTAQRIRLIAQINHRHHQSMELPSETPDLCSLSETDNDDRKDGTVSAASIQVMEDDCSQGARTGT